jgi:hypothetical protein
VPSVSLEHNRGWLIRAGEWGSGLVRNFAHSSRGKRPEQARAWSNNTRLAFTQYRIADVGPEVNPE